MLIMFCGFTKQYSDLQKLWDDYKQFLGLVVIGVLLTRLIKKYSYNLVKDSFQQPFFIKFSFNNYS